VTEVVAWAASNGDRSDNADYHYGKRRLRQIDGRIRFLTKRIEAAEVVDPETPRAGETAARAFFGATVRYANGAGAERFLSAPPATSATGSPRLARMRFDSSIGRLPKKRLNSLLNCDALS
jgi:hypothetical protein